MLFTSTPEAPRFPSFCPSAMPSPPSTKLLLRVLDSEFSSPDLKLFLLALMLVLKRCSALWVGASPSPAPADPWLEAPALPGDGGAWMLTIGGGRCASLFRPRLSARASSGCTTLFSKRCKMAKPSGPSLRLCSMYCTSLSPTMYISPVADVQSVHGRLSSRAAAPPSSPGCSMSAPMAASKASISSTSVPPAVAPPNSPSPPSAPAAAAVAVMLDTGA
mmetsp:Transcript_558/g.1429  ORF Transcript_558/g.1429 Transcript_558/m.1429 type:complete len:219 (-) Transcript_558:260-916(-)